MLVRVQPADHLRIGQEHPLFLAPQRQQSTPSAKAGRPADTHQDPAAIANWRGIAGACFGGHLVCQASIVFHETR
eukprot:4184715-Heterocapsa_arctica.AAC.1